jgi:methylisocitrate lyase
MQTRRELYELIGYHDYEALDDAIARSVLPDERAGNRASEHGGP